LSLWYLVLRLCAMVMMMLMAGCRFLVTRQLREHDAGILELGLTYTDLMAIPPRQQAFPLTGVCSGHCTEVGLPPSGIKVFASQLHTHGAGRRVETTLVRADGQEVLVNRDNHYSHHFQVQAGPGLSNVPYQASAYTCYWLPPSCRRSGCWGGRWR